MQTDTKTETARDGDRGTERGRESETESLSRRERQIKTGSWTIVKSETTFIESHTLGLALRKTPHSE